jgi:regulatory protein
MELIRAGVKKDVADAALDEVYDDKSDSLAAARLLAEKKAPSLKKLDPLTARRRLAGMLQRRGFDYETIKPVIDQVLGDTDRADE